MENCDLFFLYRVHCQNVFEQLQKVKAQMEALNSTLTSDPTNFNAFVDTQERYDKLFEIFTLSGCYIQACKSLLLLMPDIRPVGNSLIADVAAVKLATTG